MSLALEYIFTHVFLPIKLPQQDDYDEEKDRELCSMALVSLRSFKSISNCKDWSVVVDMIARLIELKKKLDKVSRIEAVCFDLKALKESDVIVMPIKEQNACLLIRSCLDKIIFEAFEVDPPNEVVMGTTGRIVRSFPDTSITVPNTSISNEFKKELASFLVKMDEDVLEGSAAHTRKAGEDHIEVRDTADPHYITGLLMSVLSGLADSSPTKIDGIVKHTRNDILWDQTYKPWRRSPLWLVIRVSVQLTLHQLGYPVDVYKNYMAFFMADLLSSEQLAKLPGDMVFCAQSKLGHRMRKLADAQSASVELMNKVLEVTEGVSKKLHLRWSEIQAHSRQVSTPEWAPSRLDFKADTEISLSNLQAYLDERIKKRAEPPNSPSSFIPPTHHRLFMSKDPYSDLDESNLEQAMQNDCPTALVEIEYFVLEWLADLDVQRRPLDAVKLSKCVEVYITNAGREYKNNPETSSIMVLTVFVLWMILDKLTILKLPLLKEYSPEVPITLLNPILLSTSLQIRRYVMVQRYIVDRRRAANSSLPSIFANQAVYNSFAVRHFNSSDSLRALKAQIEASAEEKRDAKLKELVEKKKERSSLLAQSIILGHDYNFRGDHNKWSCSKCNLDRQADELSINVHEWPLPTQELYAMWTVFECDVPAEFRAWRGTTYNILYGLCRPDLSSSRDNSARCSLSEYDGLSRYVKNVSTVTIASSTKSFVNSHYRSLSVSEAMESSICVKNGLSFKQYDTQRSRWIDGSSFKDCALDKICTWEMPQLGTYDNLSYAISSTTHSPNVFIADQSEAPTTLDLHEHMSFGNLRSGSNLQWLNILRELHTRVLSFSRQEVQSLVLQAALQAGPVTDSKGQTQHSELALDWHRMLAQQSFSKLLLDEITSLLQDIEENWAHDITLETLILLTLRLLASHPPELLPHIFETLYFARKISHDWMTTLVDKLAKSAGSSSTETVSDVPDRIFVSAALCQLTYHVDASHLCEVFKNDEDVAIFVECSIRLHDNTPPGNLSPQLGRLLARSLRLLHHLHSNDYFQTFVEKHQPGLHSALEAIWKTYSRRSNSEWHSHPDGDQSWITLEWKQVHLNLKDGTLLVKGKPLGRLPGSITRHATYRRLLGNQVLDVAPNSTQAGSDFETCDYIAKSGFQLHFRLEDTTLVIQSINESQRFELIPHDILASDFPAFYIRNYTHWLFTGHDGILRIEFRPLQNCWQPSDSNWHLILDWRSSTTFQSGADSPETRMRLVDIHSKTFKMISSVLQPLDTVEFIHVTWSPESSKKITATLPRYRLSFTLDVGGDGELHSDNFPRMVVDRIQGCGTLYGLQNILVLRSVTSIMARTFPSEKRSIIIPFDYVNVNQNAEHVVVEVQKPKEAQLIQYFKYNIDNNLCSLVGTTLLSELYRIYLHAITSYFLPDPLLQHTGTDEAVGFLRSSKSKSFQNLGNEEEGLLLQIAGLATKRNWYPESHQVMQSVEWFDILPLSQHWSFPILVDEILQFAESLSLFSGSHQQEQDTRRDLASIHGHLAKRSLSHNLHLLSPWDYQQNFEHFHDSIHLPSDSPHRSLQTKNPPLTSRAKNAGLASVLVQKWPKGIETNCDPWKLLSDAPQPIHRLLTGFSLTYDNHFLNMDFSKTWLPFYIACISASDQRVCKAQLMFTLPAIAYERNEKEVVSSLLAFATYPEFRSIYPPQWKNYDLSRGCSPTHSELETLIQRHVRQLGPEGCHYCPPDNWNRGRNESEYSFNVRRRLAHEANCQKDVEFLSSFLVEQWNNCPSRDLALPSNCNDYGHVNLSSDAMTDLNNKLANWFSNFQLATKFIRPVHDVLRKPPMVHTGPYPETCFSVQKPLAVVSKPIRQCSSVSLMDLLRPKAFDILNLIISWTRPTPQPSPTVPVNPSFPRAITSTALSQLLAEFVTHEDIVHAKYGWLLEKSCRSRDQNHANILPDTSAYSDNHFAEFFRSCEVRYQDLLNVIRDSLHPRSTDLQVMDRIQSASFHWPKVNVRSLLALWHITTTLPPLSTEAMLSAAIIRALAQALIHLQRSQRLGNFWLEKHDDEIAKELANEPDLDSQSIDWLFIQIEGNFLARPLQIEVAKKMIAPYDGNTVIQLNMGEGKSSVIVPLVASTLADGKKLTRVVVLKPLAKAMFALLVQRLSGIVNRRVFYFPFSRAVDVTPARSQKLQQFFNICLKERGVLIAQPEHILSFKLIGIDLIAKLPIHTECESTVRNLLQSQKWLTECCRDILDESDEILSVKYQLIYTSGRQAPIENHPYRWLQIQAILSLVLDCVRKTQSVGWSEIECENVSPSEFPIIRVVDAITSKRLFDKVAEALLEDLKFQSLSESLRDDAKQFISSRSMEEDKIKLLRTELTPGLWSSLLLYRGFCAFGILDHLFREKRWRVNYGLYLARTLLAVPYRAKDVPAPRADFGHPDVTVSLTCLSYYHGGLTKDQFEETVRLLLKLDNPSQEYSLWTAKANPSTSLPAVAGINLADSVLCNKLYNVLKRNHAVINFYLATVVFPKEAKQFPKKLTTSAWDLAEDKKHPATGFSGTNDNRDLLPLSIVQRDPVGQLGTNAHVLHCLLQHENDHYIRLTCQGVLLSEDYLMALTTQSHEIRVLLDVGAQLLDKKNDEIASRWLNLRPKAEAAVFFDDDDRLVVMTQDKRIEIFEVSPYSQKLESCLVYLDDAHTRGTDLKLPSDYRAAVTLGTGLNKDRLVQGCMRMRKLGVGQSVMFFAPQEVDTIIRRLAKKQAGERVNTIDILRWVMTETCNSIHHNIPHWAQQGLDYNRRNNVWTEFWEQCNGPLSANNPPTSALLNLRKNWEDDDARGLEAMYGSSGEKANKHPALDVPELRLHLAGLGIHSLGGISMDEEQERELSHEAEQEREVERPPPAQPAKNEVHSDVLYLVQHGKRKDSSAFVSMFSPLSVLDGFSPNLWSTKDFATTIVVNTSEDAIEYQRPVHWLLTSKKDSSIVALSPYEVNELLPIIQKSKYVHLHMYAPRVNQTMSSFEDLAYFVIPPLSSDRTLPSKVDITQINLWAGQLYLKDEESYETLLMVLGIVRGQLKGMRFEPDGFVFPQNRTGTMKEVCTFQKSPLLFLRNLMGLRQKGKSYLSTHIGKILEGKPLTEGDFQQSNKSNGTSHKNGAI